MRTSIVTALLGAVLVTACGGEPNVSVAPPPPQAMPAPVSHVVDGIDFGNPEAVLLAYLAAGDKGDGETMKRCLRPSQRATFVGGHGKGLPGPRTHQIVRREDRSASEVCLFAKAGESSFVMAHVLVFEDGKWYLDFRKSLDATMGAPGGQFGNPPPRPASKAGTR